MAKKVPVLILGQAPFELSAGYGYNRERLFSQHGLCLGALKEKRRSAFCLSTTEIPVTITVKTTISQQEHSETMEITAPGHFYKKDNALFLKYEEKADIGTVRTVVKAGDKEALILRNGALKMKLPFMLDLERTGHYEMPFGTFETSTMTKKIDYSYQSESGRGHIHILYDFSLQGSDAGTYELYISFLEVE